MRIARLTGTRTACAQYSIATTSTQPAKVVQERSELSRSTMRVVTEQAVCRTAPSPLISSLLDGLMAHSRSSAARAVTSRTTPRPTRFPQFRGQRVVRRWRYRMAPDPLTRQAQRPHDHSGRAPAPLLVVVGLGASLSCGRLVHDDWGWAAGTGAMAFVSYLITPSEYPPRYGLDHEFSVDDEEFLPTMAGRPGCRSCPATASTSSTTATSSTRRCSRRSSDAEVSITIEAYIYWAGDIGRAVRRGAGGEGARAGVRVKILLDAVGSSTHRRGDPRDPRSAAAASSPGTTRSASTASAASTTAPIASRSSSTAASRSPAAPASPITGGATRGTRASGATCRSGSKDRR